MDFPFSAIHGIVSDIMNEIEMKISDLSDYRAALYASFDYRADARMDLLDALLSNVTAQSVVALSLSPFFQRQYSSITDAIDATLPLYLDPIAARREQELTLARLIGPHLPQPQSRHFWLVALDATSYPRLFASTLSDRGFVYQPNAIAGNKPVTIGHQYEALVVLPELKTPHSSRWVVPLMMRRITTDETENQVGAEMLNAVLNDDQLPFQDDLTVAVEDSKYSVVNHLGRVFPNDNLVVIARSRGNRVYYRVHQSDSDQPRGPGAPKRYGERFDLHDESTWGAPDEIDCDTYTSKRGHIYTVRVEAWHDLIMKGTREYRMWDKPFTVVRVRFFDKNGQLAFRRTMWLIVIGERRQELTLKEIWHAYQRRYDAEHFFRFGKQRLLLTAYQTPDTEHEETWVQLVQVAYTELWLMHHIAQALPNPWEQYLPQPADEEATPSQTQRDAGRILSAIGTPAKVPKPRGNSSGRASGVQMPPRKRHPVVKKGKKRAPSG